MEIQGDIPAAELVDVHVDGAVTLVGVALVRVRLRVRLGVRLRVRVSGALAVLHLLDDGRHEANPNPNPNPDLLDDGGHVVDDRVVDPLAGHLGDVGEM